MSIKDRMSHAANLTKWKVDQQRRILKKQGEITEIENQVRVLKARLADAALALYLKDLLTEEDLKSICSQIGTSLEVVATKKSELDEVRKERPPEAVYTASLPLEETAGVTHSGLVCPECGKELVGRFCPDHGREGAAKSSAPLPIEGEPEDPDQTGGLECPQCGRLLKGRFCPDHGLQGAPVGEVPSGTS